MLCRYYKYVRQEMLKNFKAGTGCRGVPMSLPRLVELVRGCACEYIRKFLVVDIIPIGDWLPRGAHVAAAPRGAGARMHM